jgi:pilus assembly protein Flp/PilA
LFGQADAACGVTCRPVGELATRANQTRKRETVMKLAREKRFLRAKRFINDTVGANLVEYIILVGVVALLAMAGFKYFGSSVRTKINQQAGIVGSISSS